jgi:hypothetical protein
MVVEVPLLYDSWVAVHLLSGPDGMRRKVRERLCTRPFSNTRCCGLDELPQRCVRKGFVPKVTFGGAIDL